MAAVSEVFFRVAEAMAEVHGKPLPKKLMEIGNLEWGWHVQFNNTQEPVGDIEPLDCLVTFNGWPAGVIGPSGGTLCAGSVANESSLLAWLRSRVTNPTEIYGVRRDT